MTCIQVDQYHPGTERSRRIKTTYAKAKVVLALLAEDRTKLVPACFGDSSEDGLVDWALDCA
jgi:hypothetical protein